MESGINEIANLFESIRAQDPSNAYDMFKKYFERQGPPVCTSGIAGYTDRDAFYRARPHLESNNNFFYKNVSELSYRKDTINIKNFGRSNEPHQSIFYCSNNSAMAYGEVASLVKNRDNMNLEYFTTGVWKTSTLLIVSPVIEDEKKSKKNEMLVGMTEYIIKRLTAELDEYRRTYLIDFMKLMSKEFTKPFSKEKTAYLLSAAYSNHVLNQSRNGNKIDGIIYPSCSDNIHNKERGFNVAFRPEIIGFGNKIEFSHALRGKAIKRGHNFYQIEEIRSKDVNKETGEIIW